MRSKDLKINGQIVKGILAAGWLGAKVYHTKLGVVLSIGRVNHLLEEKSQDEKTVLNLVTLNYQPRDKHEEIKEKFADLVSRMKPKKNPQSHYDLMKEVRKIAGGFDLTVNSYPTKDDTSEIYEVGTFEDRSVGMYGMSLVEISPDEVFLHEANLDVFLSDFSQDEKKGFYNAIDKIVSLVRKHQVRSNPSHPIYAKGVPKLPKGFSGEWVEEDWLDAIDAYNMLANREMRKGPFVFSYQKSVIVDPKILLKKAITSKVKPGIFKNLPKTEWKSLLLDFADESRWERIIELYEKDELNSVIVFDDDLYDGFHRTILAYLLGQKVVTALFKVKKEKL